MSGKDDVTFYRDFRGLWVESSQEDIEKYIRSTCKTQITSRCTILHEAKYCLHYDEEMKGVQIVLGREEYDFSKNNYYRVFDSGRRT